MTRGHVTHAMWVSTSATVLKGILAFAACKSLIYTTGGAIWVAVGGDGMCHWHTFFWILSFKAFFCSRSLVREVFDWDCWARIASSSAWSSSRRALLGPEFPVAREILSRTADYNANGELRNTDVSLEHTSLSCRASISFFRRSCSAS